MSEQDTPAIRAVRKFDDAAEVEFEDGTTGIYPATFLHPARELGGTMFDLHVDDQISRESGDEPTPAPAPDAPKR